MSAEIRSYPVGAPLFAGTSAGGGADDDRCDALRAEAPAVFFAFLAVGTLFVIIAFSFRQLRIRDEGERLAIRFGPLPLFWKRFAYADLASVDRDKTRWIDGWGIHWIPLRGWTYNLWGFCCVRLTLRDGRTIRLGTDDPEGLVEFLRGILQVRSSRSP